MKRILAVAIAFVTLPGAAGRLASAQPEPGDRLDYGGVVLEPGDVISFVGGWFTLGGMALTHGHTSMYLGFDAETRQQIFLDFSTTKDGVVEMVFGSPRAFGGRILPEREFLTYNYRSHPSFDVYRLVDRSTLDKRKMFRAARKIASTQRYGFSGTVCSSAVSDVLSAATGRKLGVVTPDGFASPPFRKHPQQGGEPIEIERVLRQLGRITAPPPQSAETEPGGMLSKVIAENKARADAQRAAQEDEIRTPDQAEENAARREARALAWAYLKATLSLACADPDNLRSLSAQRRTWGVLISRGSVAEFFARDRAQMSPCAQTLMTALVQSDGPVDVKWIEKQGRKHYEAAQRRARREQEAAERSARAVSARAEYERAEGRLSSERTWSGRNGSSGEAVKGLAFNQAVMLSGGTMTFDGR